jgi:nascent polypeptide-associated complex subunit alpha
MNSQAQLSAAQQLSSGGAGAAQTLEESGAGGADDDDDEPPELEAAEEDGSLDETGVDPKDIDLVMQQVNCSRAKAVRVLKESGGDLINASKSIFLFLLHVIKSPALQLWQRASRSFCVHRIHSVA